MNENLEQWSIRMALGELGQNVSAGGFGLEDVPEAARALAPDSSLAANESVVAFSRFVELMRRKRGMTVEQLADACGIEVAEVVNIEDEVLTGVGPRTVFQIAKCFEVSEAKLMQLSGLKRLQEPSLGEQSLRFAARSNSMASLTREEREALDQFVAELGDR